jgi:hypothetical protein
MVGVRGENYNGAEVEGLARNLCAAAMATVKAVNNTTDENPKTHLCAAKNVTPLLSRIR